MGTSFQNIICMDTPLIGKILKQIERSHGVSLNHWVSGLVYITVQTCYYLQCITIRFSGYMNTPAEPAFIDIKHNMDYLMHHPPKTIM